MKYKLTIAYLSRVLLIFLACIVTATHAQETSPKEGSPAEGWPRLYESEGNKIIIYQPQDEKGRIYTNNIAEKINDWGLAENIKILNPGWPKSFTHYLSLSNFKKNFDKFSPFFKGSTRGTRERD